MNKHSEYNWLFVVLLIWSMSFLAGFASAADPLIDEYTSTEEPKVLPQEPDEKQEQIIPPGKMAQVMKPVTCTQDEYSDVKENMRKSHGEVGMARYYADQGTGVEILANPMAGTITILEYLPNGLTCIISTGKRLEVNSEWLRDPTEANTIQTTY